MKHIWWMLCWLLLGASVGVVVRALIHEDTPEEPVVRDITGICPTCGLVLPYAETRRIMVCQGHEFEEVIAVAGVQDDYMDVTIREGEPNDPNRAFFYTYDSNDDTFYFNSDVNDLAIIYHPKDTTSPNDVMDITWGFGSEMNYDENTITITGMSLEDAFRRLFYYASESWDPNEYLMSAEIVMEENK